MTIDLKRNRSMKPVSLKSKPAQLMKNSGFTLMELMIVLAIIGVLAAIAFPSYQEYVRDSRRSNCAGELELLANAMERSFSLNSSYPGAIPAGFAPAAVAGPVTCPIDGGTPAYQFAVAVPPAPANTTFVVSAIPIGPQAGDDCGTLTLNQLGTKGMQGAAAGLTVQDCW
jgi:type IV pilus assembly protein PilE